MNVTDMFVLLLSSRCSQKSQNCCYETCKVEVLDTVWYSWLQLGTLLVPFSKGERVLCGVKGGMDPVQLGVSVFQY